MKYLLLIFCLILYSCVNEGTNEEEILIGCCPKIIGSRLSFNLEGGVDSISVGYSSWHFWDTKGEYEFIRNNKNEIIKVDGGWFSAVRDEETIFVSVKQNNTKRKRSSPLIWIRDDNYHNCKGNFSITQSAE